MYVVCKYVEANEASQMPLKHTRSNVENTTYNISDVCKLFDYCTDWTIFSIQANGKLQYRIRNSRMIAFSGGRHILQYENMA